ncbi:MULTISPECIES: amylosucrase [Pseudoxanthomonas]|uniref:Amylosucrase n=1 Tax=Pseudoxanthomonas winnipegensis TaxID=2480810 RepID=A0AAW8GH21_9GAMM|nr:MULTISPECIES: amylosucrase [Pseudoxanthomonas]MDQ1121057.1 amylosucrase [Pseudoxanthomonas winnipegensis]MDQ1134287.1 amylosucrase [Pseudoxanthomonas winnipegensis]MDR6139480.1 amylosucrase [Pseudoxanthomonas sp. SORGH_AS_0997]
MTHTPAPRATLVSDAPDPEGLALGPRWARHAPRLLEALRALYGEHPDYAGWLSSWLQAVAEKMGQRPQALAQLDATRAPDWFGQPDMAGYSTYVDRFAGDLRGLTARVPYLQDLGVRYLHLLPFLRMRPGDSDGGFAVSDYGQVDPRLGSNDDLRALTAQLRAAGISLCADFVLNHTADDHAWAQAARAGDPHYRDYYHLYPDRRVPDAYERTLGQVFPRTAPGNFSWVEDAQAWAWTTFYPFQWDLDWRNPHVFGDMALALLELANLGVEVFRLDSTAYLWKRPGTDCMNQPETHIILRALRALVDIAAPCVALKAEAIVPMDQLPPYFGQGAHAGEECHLAYHSSLMAAGWSALALQRADIVANVIARTPPLPPAAGWLAYVRCHDDIGWNVLRAEASGATGLAPFSLAQVEGFYAGRTPGSFARGESFQSDGEGVHGSNGMASALCGLQAAEEAGDPAQAQRAIDRMLLLYSLAMAMPGIPMLYMGDELALGNDTTWRADPLRRGEGRWLHRPPMDWDLLAQAQADAGTPHGRALAGLRALIATRKRLPALASTEPLDTVDTGDARVLAVRRGADFLAVGNFSDADCTLSLDVLSDGAWTLVAGGQARHADTAVHLGPWGFAWLSRPV